MFSRTAGGYDARRGLKAAQRREDTRGGRRRRLNTRRELLATVNKEGNLDDACKQPIKIGLLGGFVIPGPDAEKRERKKTVKSSLRRPPASMPDSPRNVTLNSPRRRVPLRYEMKHRDGRGKATKGDERNNSRARSLIK